MSDDRWNSDDERAPYIDRAPLPRLSTLPKPKATLVTPEEIFTWLKDVFGGAAKGKKGSQ